MLKNHYLIPLFLLLGVSQSYAATLKLSNGDIITGETQPSNVPGHVKIETSYGQVVFIPEREIEEIDNTPVARTPKKVIGFTNPTTSPAYDLALQKAKARNEAMALEASEKKAAKISATKDVSETSTNKPTDTLWGAVWKGRANFGAGLRTGNAEQNSINTDASLSAKWGETHRATLKGALNREKDNGLLTEDNKNLNLAYDYFFKPRWFLNNAAGIESDKIDLIDLRTDIGVGLGHQMFEQDDLNLKFILGGSFLRQEYANRSSDSSMAYKWSLDYDQKFFDDLFQFFHDHKILVPSDDTEDFLVDSATGLRVPLRKGLIATTEVQFDWDNKPEIGAVEDDTIYSLKLGYEW